MSGRRARRIKPSYVRKRHELADRVHFRSARGHHRHHEEPDRPGAPRSLDGPRPKAFETTFLKPEFQPQTVPVRMRVVGTGAAGIVLADQSSGRGSMPRQVRPWITRQPHRRPLVPDKLPRAERTGRRWQRAAGLPSLGRRAPPASTGSKGRDLTDTRAIPPPADTRRTSACETGSGRISKTALNDRRARSSRRAARPGSR